MDTHQCAGVWIVAESSAGRVLPVSYELLTRGRALAEKRGAELTAAVLGDGLDDADLRGLIDRGADRVLAVEAAALAEFLVEPHSACLLWLLRQHRPEVVLAAATSTGRTLMPYVAARAGAGLTADCTELDIEPDTGNLLQTRPAIGGNILATIKTPTARPQMATVRAHSTRPADPAPRRSGQVLRLTPPPELLASRTRRVQFIPSPDRHSLQDADAVVSVGRGIGKADRIDLVRRLAERLDAALGASRDVVDRGWLGYPHQVGLSGKTVAPRLYVAVGLSGSIQHLAGMQTSEHVVAINSDPDAQIFRVAQLGVVGDLFEVVPALIERLDKARNSD